MFSGLSKHLNSHIVRDHILFDESAAEVIFSFRGSWEAYFYLLETYPDQLTEKFQFFAQTHGNNKSLIAVSEVNAAPLGSVFDEGFFDPFSFSDRRSKELPGVLVNVFHNKNLLVVPALKLLSCRGKKISLLPANREETKILINSVVPLFLVQKTAPTHLCRISTYLCNGRARSSLLRSRSCLLVDCSGRSYGG